MFSKCFLAPEFQLGAHDPSVFYQPIHVPVYVARRQWSDSEINDDPWSFIETEAPEIYMAIAGIFPEIPAVCKSNHSQAGRYNQNMLHSFLQYFFPFFKDAATFYERMLCAKFTALPWVSIFLMIKHKGLSGFSYDWVKYDYPHQYDPVDHIIFDLLMHPYPFSNLASDEIVVGMSNQFLSIASRGRSEYAAFEVEYDGHYPLDDCSALFKQSEGKIDLYPNKVISGAENIRLFASEVYKGIINCFPQLRDKVNKYIGVPLIGFWNDQVAAALLWSIGLYMSGMYEYDNACALAVAAIACPVEYKSFTTVLKSLGLNATNAGAMLVEANVLRGKGNVQPDLLKDATRRIGKSGEDLPVYVDPEVLRPYVREIMDIELPKAKYEIGSYDDHIKSNWAWMKNGTHNWYVNNKYPELYGSKEKYMADTFDQLKGTTVRRRALAEMTPTEVYSNWNGEVYANVSNKSENDKDRPIYGCDTYSYVNFAWPFNYIEKQWQNHTAILDPGAGGYNHMAGRIYSILTKRGELTNVMADYEDFNVQHTNANMAMVIDEALGRISNFPQEMRDKLVGSFEKTFVTYKGEELGRVTGTLMSGHRCTTFINTVLNVAYFRYVSDKYKIVYYGLHTGDDAAGFVDSPNTAFRLLDAMRTEGFRLKRPKQCVNNFIVEFLRVSYRLEFIGKETKMTAWGYFSRNVASLVSGNWSSEGVSDTDSKITSFLGAAYTAHARSLYSNVQMVLLPSFMRICKLNHEMARRLLSFEAGYKGSPIITLGTYYRGYIDTNDTSYINEALELRKKRYSTQMAIRQTKASVLGKIDVVNEPVGAPRGAIDVKWLQSYELVQSNEDVKLTSGSLPMYATESYLTNMITPVQRSVLAQIESSPKVKMASACYVVDDKGREPLQLRTKLSLVEFDAHGRLSVYSRSSSEYDMRELIHMRYPVMMLMKSRLKAVHYKMLAEELDLPYDDKQAFKISGYNGCRCRVPWSVLVSWGSRFFGATLVSTPFEYFL